MAHRAPCPLCFLRQDIEVGVPSGVTPRSSLGGQGSNYGSTGSFSHVMEKFMTVPLHVRGRAEAWETPRSQIKLMEKLGEGETGCVYKCRWRGLDCAAKILTQNSRTSVAVSRPS